MVPLTAWIGRYLVESRLSWNQILAMTVSIGGVFLGAVVQLNEEKTNEEHNLTLIGLLFLSLSAFF